MSFGRSLDSVASVLARTACLALPVFVLAEVNYPVLAPQSQLAIFAMLGLVICFLAPHSRETPDAADAPPIPGATGSRAPRALGLALALAAVGVFGYVVVQTEPAFSSWWLDGRSLGDRAGIERALDFAIGAVGLLLVLEATRRAIGLALPLLSLVFVAYAVFGPALPDWALPHRGYGLERIVGQAFLQSQGVFGVALRVMFSYVFLFVVFGAVLEAAGATGYIIDTARRLLARRPGGAAKVAVLSSGLMGSLSGSAVANTATTGTFTIPMMRSSGFAPHIAAGIEAAASSGGALVPPVMGAGAYMMLELVEPQVTYLQIIRAALLPACLYYLSIYLIVHFYARRLAAKGIEAAAGSAQPAGAARLLRWEGAIFFGALGSLVVFLVAGFSVFRAVTVALALTWALALFHGRTRIGPRALLAALEKASRGGVALVAAAACVGIVIGVVTLTGAGTRFPSLILPLAQDNLALALALLMISSIVLGMGLPSVVCYLLLATLVGPVLGRLGVVPLAAHLFIFYFGMMSMVTPPVALAAYAASSIAGSKLLASANAAFRFALVGFTLPFLFVFRPQLLMLDAGGGPAAPLPVVVAVIVAVLGIVPLAAGIAGYLLGRLGAGERALLLAAAAMGLFPETTGPLAAWDLSPWNLAGIALFALVLAARWRASRKPRGSPDRSG